MVHYVWLWLLYTEHLSQRIVYNMYVHIIFVVVDTLAENEWSERIH